MPVIGGADGARTIPVIGGADAFCAPADGALRIVGLSLLLDKMVKPTIDDKNGSVEIDSKPISTLKMMTLVNRTFKKISIYR